MGDEMLSYSRGNMHDAFMISGTPNAAMARAVSRRAIVTQKAPLCVTLVTISGEIAR